MTEHSIMLTRDWRQNLWINVLLSLLFIALLPGTQTSSGAEAPALREEVLEVVTREYPSLLELYKHLHANPELSFQEKRSAERMAKELRDAGYEVATGVGRLGVVGVLRNGVGSTVLVRADMDGLPVREQTGLPYASTATTTDDKGNPVPVMHACGHDVHMTCLIGAARTLAQLKDSWQGTLVLLLQPAEEAGGGARTVIADGLFTRFPKPDVCIALHDSAEIAAGMIGYTPGYAMANVDSVDVIIKGVGGHGAHPHGAKDPIVLAAQTILSLQTIVSRETRPGDAAVVTVGTIHGGTKRNIIPDEVVLQLTVRSYADEVRTRTLEAIRRIVRGQAIAAGIPEDRMPEVNVGIEYTPSTYNDPQLTEKLVALFKAWFGESNVIPRPPSTGGEDFSEYGRTVDKIPICMFSLGGVDPKAIEERDKNGKALPGLHSPLWAPLPEPTLKTGVTALSAAVLELCPKRPGNAQ